MRLLGLSIAACLVLSAPVYASYVLVFSPDQTLESYDLAKPYGRASVEVNTQTADPYVHIRIDGELIDLPQNRIFGIPGIEVHSVSLGRDGYDPEHLVLVLQCYTDEEQEEHNNAVIHIEKLKMTNIDDQDCLSPDQPK